jgi:translocation protein SEC62
MSNISKSTSSTVNRSVSFEEKELQIRKDLSDIFIQLLEDKGLPVKETSLPQLERRVLYCRGKELKEFLKTNYDQIRKRINETVDVDIGNYSVNSNQNFYNVFHTRKMLCRVDRVEGDKAKYPKRLLLDTNIETFDENKFYWINYIKEDRRKKSQYIYLVICVSVVIFGCLFPIWPLWVKLSVWWVLFIILIVLVSIY